MRSERFCLKIILSFQSSGGCNIVVCTVLQPPHSCVHWPYNDGSEVVRSVLACIKVIPVLQILIPRRELTLTSLRIGEVVLLVVSLSFLVTP